MGLIHVLMKVVRNVNLCVFVKQTIILWVKQEARHLRPLELLGRQAHILLKIVNVMVVVMRCSANHIT